MEQPAPAFDTDSFVRDMLRQEAANLRTLSFLLDKRLKASEHFLACRTDARGFPSYLISAPLEWVARNVRFPQAGLKYHINKTAALKDSPDWGRQASLVIDLAAGNFRAFPPLTVVGFQRRPSLPDGICSTQLSGAGALFDINLSDAVFYAASNEDALLAVHGLRQVIWDGSLIIYKPNGLPVRGKTLTMESIVREVRRSGEDESETEARIKRVILQRVGVEIVPGLLPDESPAASKSRLSTLLDRTDETTRRKGGKAATKTATPSKSPGDSAGIVAACAAIMNAVFAGDEKQTDHAAAVAAMAAQMGGSPEIVAAAYLHDVAEDATPENQTPAEFLKKLGVPERVARIVLIVTRHINGRESYAEFISRILNHGGPDGKAAIAVKRADLIVNRARCIGKPGFEELLRRYENALQQFPAQNHPPQ